MHASRNREDQEFGRPQPSEKWLRKPVKPFGRSSQKKLNRNSPRPGATVFKASSERGEFEEALASADKAIELNPNFDVPHGVRGFALLGLGRPLLAMQSVRRALRLNPKPSHAITAGMLGAVNYGVGRTDRAVEHWEQSRSANSDMILPRIGLAAHYESVGRHREALTLVQEVLRVNPNLTAEIANSMSLRREEWPTLLRRAGLP